MNQKYLKLSMVMVGLLSLTACTTKPSQSVYRFDEAGRSVMVDYGTVVDLRPITIDEKGSGLGAIGGAAAGAAAGSGVGKGRGQDMAVVGGALIGGVTAGMIEDAFSDSEGVLYTIVMQDGRTITSPQYFNDNDTIIQKGDRVIVQTSGSFERVLPANNIPTEMNRPKGVTFVD